MKNNIVVINLKDQGQDLITFTVDFGEGGDYVLGKVTDTNTHQSIYVGQYVISGNPKTGSFLTVSHAPNKPSSTIKYPVESVTKSDSRLH